MSDYQIMSASERRACGLSVLVDDIGDGTLERAYRLLAGIPKGASKAISSAIKRAATSGEAFAAKEIRKEYHIKAGDFKKYTRTERKYVRGATGTTVDVVFRGYHIPLIRFDTRVSRGGIVTARVKRSSVKQVLENAFVQTMPGGHVGLFERVSDARMPIREFFGPSVPQMLSANEDVEQAMGDHIRETFDDRLEHEIVALLSGWRT